MTLISEQFFKPYSSCHLAYAKPSHLPPADCACQSPVSRPTQGGGPNGVCRRLGRLLDKDIARLENGKSGAKLFKRGKLIARWARAVKDIATVARADQIKTSAGKDTHDLSGQAPPYPWERTASVPLGVEAFRMAVAKELSLIRNKKENIP